MSNFSDDSTEDAITLCLDRALESACYLTNELPQISSGVITAFGVRLHSRYGRCHEMVEMMNFVLSCAEAGASCFLREVYYDTREGVAKFIVHGDLDQDSTDIFRSLANRHFSKYRWIDGYMGGRDF